MKIPVIAVRRVAKRLLDDALVFMRLVRDALVATKLVVVAYTAVRLVVDAVSKYAVVAVIPVAEAVLSTVCPDTVKADEEALPRVV